MTSRPKSPEPGDTLRAVLDRIEGRVAVMLVGDEEKRIDLSVDRLPAGAREGDWFKVTVENGQIAGLEPDPDETGRRRSLIQAKLELLRNKGKK